MSILKKIGIAFLIAIVTGLLGLFLGTKQADGSFIRWKTLGKPPSEIVKIAETTIGSITVETIYGELYSCDISTTEKCWNHVDEIPTAESTDCVPPKTLPRSLDNIAELQQVCFLTPGGKTESIYALRDDGNIYIWHGNRGLDENAWIIYLLSSIAGAIVGFVGTFIFFFVRWLIKLS